MRTVVSALAGLLALALVAGAADSGVSGKWKLTSKSARGERSSEITLAQDGEKLTVKSKDREGNDVTSEGTVKGSEITWTSKRQTPMGELTISYTGKVEGQTMSGTTTFSRGGTGEWKAEKIQP
jgi:hypothetical protein